MTKAERDMWRLALEVCTTKEFQAMEFYLRLNFTYEETGQRLGISRQAARARVRSGVKRLRKYHGLEEAA